MTIVTDMSEKARRCIVEVRAECCLEKNESRENNGFEIQMIERYKVGFSEMRKMVRFWVDEV